ncbi:potassium channel family protein [Tateyamaria sp.]|uniref:potassium channel family protein n=1 Tax=Tateyamaria sp. TaxID=1929288 RepID=UPI00329F7087
MENVSLIAALQNWRWTSLLVLLLGAMFLSATSDSSVHSDIITISAFTLVFVGTLRAAILLPLLKNVGLGLVALWLLLGVAGVLDPSNNFGPVFMLVTACILLGCLMVTLSELAHNKQAGLDPIMGAVFGYILIGVSWSLLYVQIELGAPGSFNSPSDHKTSSEFIYFSLVTLTSLGYGDITPAAPVSRLLAGLQAATGTIYIAVFIGRVVARFKD